MCSIIIRGSSPAPLNGADQIRNLQLFQVGDIITAVEDGHVFGKDEKPPLFVIVPIPGVAVVKVQQFLAKPKHVLNASGAIVQFAPLCGFSVDLTTLQAALAANPTMTQTQFIALVKQNAMVSNPAVIA